MRRNKLILNVVMCLACLSSLNAVAAQDNWAGVSFGSSQVKAQDSDFDLSGRYALQVGHWFSPNLAVEAGYSMLSNAKEEGEDNRGSYELKVNTDDFSVGAMLSTERSKQLRFFAGGGLLYSKIQMELSEDFYGLKSGGKASHDSTSFGYYVVGGVGLSIQEQLTINFDLSYQRRSGAVKSYSGDVDLADTALNIGLDYQF